MAADLTSDLIFCMDYLDCGLVSDEHTSGMSPWDEAYKYYDAFEKCVHTKTQTNLFIKKINKKTLTILALSYL